MHKNISRHHPQVSKTSPATKHHSNLAHFQIASSEQSAVNNSGHNQNELDRNTAETTWRLNIRSLIKSLPYVLGTCIPSSVALVKVTGNLFWPFIIIPPPLALYVALLFVALRFMMKRQ
jgi:hypothetical protein